LVGAGIEPVVSRPRGRQAPENNAGQREAFERNEANRKTEKGGEQLRRRAEKVERSFRHLLDYGRCRRATLSGQEKISKRTLISAFAFNMSIYSWHVHGFGTAKQFAAGNGNLEALLELFSGLKTAMGALERLWEAFTRKMPRFARNPESSDAGFTMSNKWTLGFEIPRFSTVS